MCRQQSDQASGASSAIFSASVSGRHFPIYSVPMEMGPIWTRTNFSTCDSRAFTMRRTSGAGRDNHEARLDVTGRSADP